jgi:hypothetical protein
MGKVPSTSIAEQLWKVSRMFYPLKDS